MKQCLLSIDWDYFIDGKNESCGSFIENHKNIVNMWYKRYIQSQHQGKDILKSYKLLPDIDSFWGEIKAHFQLAKGTKVYVSDSHAISYDIAKDNACSSVCLFDAHADLGYGGVSALKFEVNCANWLGKLLREEQIEQAKIIYSPYTTERAEYFTPINKICNVQFVGLNELETKVKVTAIHICRSGAWTPPWFDGTFKRFVNGLSLPYKIIDCPTRDWNPDNMSLSDQISYLLA